MSIFVSNSLYQHETNKVLNCARNMYPRAHLWGQGTCCLDSSYRHMSSVSDCASFRARHVPCVRIKGNNAYLFCRAMYSTPNCGQTLCARNDIGRPLFQSDSFLIHAFCTAVRILKFDNINRFCIVSSILCFYMMYILVNSLDYSL